MVENKFRRFKYIERRYLDVNGKKDDLMERS